MTVEDIVNKVLRDKAFFDVSGGGVTLSGGEVTFFPEYTSKLLKSLKKNGINTLIETCGYFNFDIFEELLSPYIDIIYYDIKLFNSLLHKKYCGKSNEIILENFSKLFELSKKQDFVLLPRIPLIPDITDTSENLALPHNILKKQE